MAEEYVIPIIWETKGYVKVNAESLDEAIALIANADDLVMPDDRYVIENSCRIETDDQDMIELYTTAHKNGNLGAQPIDYMTECEDG